MDLIEKNLSDYLKQQYLWRCNIDDYTFGKFEMFNNYRWPLYIFLILY